MSPRIWVSYTTRGQRDGFAPQLDALQSTGSVRDVRRNGLDLLALTDAGRRALAKAREEGEVVLPESPQHRSGGTRDPRGRAMRRFRQHSERHWPRLARCSTRRTHPRPLGLSSPAGSAVTASDSGLPPTVCLSGLSRMTSVVTWINEIKGRRTCGIGDSDYYGAERGSRRWEDTGSSSTPGRPRLPELCAYESMKAIAFTFDVLVEF